MPPERDENAASSAAEEASRQDVAADSSTADQGANQDSASPTDGTSDGSDGDTGQEEDLLSVITEAAGPGEDSAEDSSDADSEQDQSEESDEDQSEESAESEGDGESDKPEPFHKHPRWQEMVRERDEFRQKAEDLEPRAQEFDKINQFMQDNELSAQEVADGLQVVAMMKNDPIRARDLLAERMETLDQYSGHKLPSDLANEVEDGRISEDRARELARLRNETQFASERQKRTEQKSQEQLDQERQNREQEQVQKIIQDQRSAIQDWESKLKAKDPDYGRIQSFVAKELRFQVQQNPPRNVDEAIQLADKAYKSVKDEFKKALPERPEVRPSATSDQSSASSASGQQPSSFMDAIKQAANQS